MPAIAVSGLVKTFGRTRALDGLDLTVEEGEVHGFLGPNGAGKTTTIRILLGLLRADAGTVRVLGADPWRDAVALHGRMAYVPGDVDFGAGLIASRPGPATASRALRTPLGLAWRLHRAPLIGWLIGLFLVSLTFGLFTRDIEKYFAENPAVVALMSGGAEDVIDGYLGVTTVLLSVFAGVYGVTAVLRARGEETSGRAEPVLATRVSRWRWLGSHVAVAGVGTAALLLAIGAGLGIGHAAATGDPGQVPRLVGVAFVNAPAAAAPVALAVGGFGLVPRLAAAAAWTLVGVVLVVAIFDDIADLPEWLRRLSPYTHTPFAPVEPVTATPPVALSALGVALLVAGFAGLRRRDIGRS